MPLDPLLLADPLLLVHPRRPFSVDLTTLGATRTALDGLPWARVFAEMAALEGGAIANPDEQRQVGHYWLRAPELAPTEAVTAQIRDTRQAVERFAADVRSGALTAEGVRFTDVLHVGIGGSALGPQLVVDAVGQGGLDVSYLDNTDPDGIERVLRRLGDRLRSTLVVVVSKSGGTPETANGARLVQERLVREGLAPAPRMVAITQEGSTLDRQAVDQGWLRRFPMWDWVGGRTSVSSAVGLVPAALAGVDVDGFLRGAADMDQWTRTTRWSENPAALLAGGLYLVGNGKGDRNLVVLPYADRLLLLSRYLQQLIMESLGKKLDLAGNVVHQGISVYGNKGSTDQHAYVQQLRDGRNDFCALFVQILSDGAGSRSEMTPGSTAGDYLQGFLLGTRRALHDEGRPSVVITLPEVSAFELGGFIALFERLVGFYGSLVSVNAYHQPGVEAGKKAAASILDLARRVRGALGAEPRTARQVAEALSVDPVEVFHLLERFSATGRVVRSGQGAAATYRSS